MENLFLLPQELQIKEVQGISDGKIIDLSRVSDLIGINPTSTEKVKGTVINDLFTELPPKDEFSNFGLKIDNNQTNVFPNRLNVSLFQFLGQNSNFDNIIGPKLASNPYDYDARRFQTQFF